MAPSSVLVIDDEYGVRSGIRQILEMEGYEVEEAECGKTALSRCQSRPFDVLLIDYRLPDTDGLSLLQTLRNRKVESKTCMITAYADIDTAIAATREGIDIFLPKPFSPDDLLGVVQNLVRHRRLQQEAEQLRKAHEQSLLALASEKSQTHSLVECLRDAVLVINRQGAVVLVNPAMGKLLKKEEPELLHKPVEEVLSSSEFAPVLNKLTEKADRAVLELELGERSFMASLVTFRSEDEQALGRILTLSDISEVRRAAMEKARFIRTMVHEFRSPLGAIKAMLEVILDRSLGDNLTPYEPFLKRADRRIEALVELIGDLLSLSRIDAEAQKPKPAEPLELGALVQEVLSQNQEKISARKLALEVYADPKLPRVVARADDVRIILTNLIGNAIKYNRDGGQISVKMNRAEPWVRIDVVDTGLGIKEENQPKIFDEFFREKKKETSEIEGNGLGLAIVKRLVERGGGRIELRSKEGAGSSFSVFLPG